MTRTRVRRRAVSRRLRNGPAVSPSRTLAAAVLAQVESGRRLDVAWEASGALGSSDRAWIRNLVYGTIRLRGRIDHVLSSCTRQPVGELDPDVRTALRLGAYQILEMGSVPDYAAVSQSVEQVKGTGSRAAAGLVNAVLRKVVGGARGEANFPDPNLDLVGYLATWGSHPEWLVRRWIREFGPQAARSLVAANNLEPRVYLRPVGIDFDRATRILADAGLAASGSSASPGRDVGSWIRLRKGTNPGAALKAVPGVIQDPAASLVTDFVSPGPGSRIADLCAAPGSKALVLGAEARGVVAADLSWRRLQRVAQGAQRLPGRVWPVLADARFPAIRGADTVLVDVPCSGTGTLRRHPDGRWRVKQGDIHHLVRVQRAILDGAAASVPLGGLLVYATCALEREENRGQVKAFLSHHQDFRVEAGSAPVRFLDRKGYLVVLPHQSGFDGAFAARLRRTTAQ